jgi:GTPase SAR1 family protein
LGPIYYRDAQGALLVYDITDEDAFQRTQNWARELRSIVGPIPMVLVGNKCDLSEQRVVTVDQAQSVASELNRKLLAEHQASKSSLTLAGGDLEMLGMAMAVETSAKMNVNVDAVFMELTRRMLALRHAADGSGGRKSQSDVQRSPVTSRRSLAVLEPSRTSAGDGTNSSGGDAKSACCSLM